MSPRELALPAEYSSSFPGLRRLFDLVPGIALLLLVGYAGKVTEQSIAAYGRAHQLTLPNIEYVLWAIVFGLVVSNTVGVPKIFDAGIDTYEFWLKAGIVLLGVRFLLGDIVALGGISLVCIVVSLITSIVVMTLLGRLGDPVGRDDGVAMDEEHRQQAPLPRAADVELCFALGDGEPTQRVKPDHGHSTRPNL